MAVVFVAALNISVAHRTNYDDLIFIINVWFGLSRDPIICYLADERESTQPNHRTLSAAESKPKGERKKKPHWLNSVFLWMNMHNTTNYGLCVVSFDEVSLSVVKMCFEKVFFSFCFVQKSTKTLWYNFLMNQIRTFVVSLNWVRILWKPFDLCVCIFCLVFVLFLKYDFFFSLCVHIHRNDRRGSTENWNRKYIQQIQFLLH